MSTLPPVQEILEELLKALGIILKYALLMGIIAHAGKLGKILSKYPPVRSWQEIKTMIHEK